MRPLDERLIQYAIDIGTFTNQLPSNRFANHIAGQLIRSGTSPAANYAEARGAESNKDFIHKLSICLKELRETQVWLSMIIASELLTHDQVASLFDETLQLTKIIAKSILTAKQNSKRKR